MFLGPVRAGVAVFWDLRDLASRIADGELRARHGDVSVEHLTTRLVVIVAENALLFGCVTVLALLFLRRRRSFPWVLSGLVALVVLLELRGLVSSPWLPRPLRPATLTSMAEILASGALWVAYLRFSDRAAATFVEPAPRRPTWRLGSP